MTSSNEFNQAFLDSLQPLSTTEFSALRKVIGFTQAQLAKQFGVSRQTVINWERGETRIPKMAEIALIAIQKHPEFRKFVATEESLRENKRLLNRDSV